METLLPTKWVSKFAGKLLERWPTVDLAMLEEVAMDLWKDEPELRMQAPVEAAAAWLAPVGAPQDSAGS